MPTTVLAISATPRLKGNSDILADRILDGCREAGAAVTKIRLRDLSLHPCIGCDACQGAVLDPCVIQDDVHGVLTAIRKTDAIVFASPIYFATINAQMKMLLDRMYALFGGGDFSVLDGKRVALAFTYADHDPINAGVMNAFRTYQDACRLLGMPLIGCVHAACLEAGAIREDPERLAQAAALGKALVSHCVSASTC